jgi:hypothetical protein
MIRLSTVSDATFAPYSNICPITGMTEVEVERTGKNKLPNENTSYTEAGVTFTTLDNGKIRLNGTSTGSIYQHDICENYSLPEGVYILSYDPVTSCSVQICNRTESAEFVSVSASTPSHSFTVTSEMANNMRVRFTIGSGKTFDNAITGVMIRLASDPATFEPYHTPQTVTTDLDRTVYGGTLDVTTGVLVVDRASVDLGTLDWRFESATNSMITSALTDLKKTTSDDVAIDALSPMSQVIPASQRVAISGCRIYAFANSTDVPFRDTGYTDATAFKASVNGLIFVYAIATPQTYQLTPQELLSVLGTNHISTDAESVEVVYRQDIGLILKRMSDSLLPYLPLTRDGIYDLKAEVTGGEKSLYWWTQEISMMSSARPMQTPIADEPVEELEEVEEMTPEEDEED